VVTSFYDGSVRIWNVSDSNNWILICTYTGHRGIVYGIDYIDADTLVTGSLDQNIKIWRISTGVTSLTIYGGGPVYSVALLSDKISLASTKWPDILIFNVNDGTQLASISSAHPNTITCLYVLSSTLFASSSYDLTIKIWYQSTRNVKFTLNGHTNSVYDLKVVASDILASSSYDTTVRLWNLTSGSLIRTLTGHTNYLLFSIDYYACSIIASGSTGTDGIKLWNIYTGESLNITTGGLQILSLAVYSAKSSK
jgi:WD40 repeat protein